MLKHPKSYDLFMHHLWKEHSSECLLSCTEFIQFQYLIVYHHDAMNIINLNENCISELDDNELNHLSPDVLNHPLYLELIQLIKYLPLFGIN